MCSSAQTTHGGLLHKSPGGLWSRPLCKRACQILQWSQGKLLCLRVAYIPGLHNIGADILSRQGLRPGNGGSIRRGGGADMEQVLSSAPGSPGESSPGPDSTTSHCTSVAGQSMVPRYNIPSRRTSSGAPRQEGPSVQSSGHNISPPTRTVETVGLASGGPQLIDSGLSTEVVETILHSRASSSSISECGPGKAQFALPSAGIRCLCPQSHPVA